MAERAGHRRRIQVGLVLIFLAAAIVNFSEWSSDYPASAIGAGVSTVALLAWPAYAIWCGRSPNERWWIFPSVFWVLAFACGLVGWWAVSSGLGAATVSQGLGPVVLLFVSTAPFYGITRYLGSPGDIWFVLVSGTIVYASTLLAFAVARRAYPRVQRRT